MIILFVSKAQDLLLFQIFACRKIGSKCKIVSRQICEKAVNLGAYLLSFMSKSNFQEKISRVSWETRAELGRWAEKLMSFELSWAGYYRACFWVWVEFQLNSTHNFGPQLNSTHFFPSNSTQLTFSLQLNSTQLNSLFCELGHNSNQLKSKGGNLMCIRLCIFNFDMN